MKYIIYRTVNNRVIEVLDKKPLSIRGNISLAQCDVIPAKYDYLTVSNVQRIGENEYICTLIANFKRGKL